MQTPKDLLWQNVSELPYFRAFLRAVEGRYLQDIPIPPLVLDLGCGDGHFGTKTFPQLQLNGVDPSFSSLLEAKKYRSYRCLINCMGDRLPYRSNFFQTVISNSVLEHISDVDIVIQEANRILKTGGRMIVTMPNDHFTKNLSIAGFLDGIGMVKMAHSYRVWFNRISRHYHPDPQTVWEERFREKNFEILESFNYFPPKSLHILEFGHYFGLPSWVNKKIFGKWVLFPSVRNIWIRKIYWMLLNEYHKDQASDEGAYSLIIAKKMK